MNMEKTHLSDSDESDEDFCPEKAAAALAGDDAASEDDDDSEEEEDDAAANTVSKRNTPKAKTKRSSNSKKTKKVKKPNKDDDDEDDTDEDNLDEEDVQNSLVAQTVPRRRTRQTEESGHEKVTLEKEKLESDDEDKTRTEALWADFLSDVKQPPKATPIAKTATSTAAISKGKEQSRERKSKTEDDRREQKTNPTPSNLESLLSRNSVKENKELKPTVGPAAAIAAVLSAQKPAISLKRPAVGGSGGAGGGLGSILHQIGKKKKTSVLEKSQSDWTCFKQDEGIDEELQTFNKGKDGYLERQDFLQRTDLRQFEIEKNLRQSRRNN